MEITFLYPAYFLFLLALPVLWFVPRRPDRRQYLMRSGILLLVILAMTRPLLLYPDTSIHQVFILDRSSSLSEEQGEQAETVLRELQAGLPEQDFVSLIVVGDEGKAEISVAGGSSSSLSAALQEASEQIPDGSSGVVTLISDGLATDRRWATAVQDLVKRGIPVNTHDLGRQERDVYPARISAEPTLRVGQTIKLAVDVIGQADDISVRLTGPSGELARSKKYSSDGRLSVPLEFEAKNAGYLSVTAEVFAAQDRDFRNNKATKTLAIQDPVNILYLGGRQLKGAAKLSALLGSGFDVTEPTRTLDEDFPLTDYDVVMLDDRPEDSLSEEFQRYLVGAVQQDGLGLLYSGGNAAFGAGGYHESRVADALPVELARREEKKDPSIGLVVLIDSGSSMEGLPMILARQVARLAMRSLKPHDRVGVVEYYDANNWIIPLQPSANKIALDRTVGRIQASDTGSFLYPALEEAYYGMKNIDTRFKHILVVTAYLEPVGDRYEDLIERITEDGVNVSTVLVGSGRYQDALFSVATWGKGQFYAVGNRFVQVEIKLREPSVTKMPEYKNGLFSVVGRAGEGWWGGVERDDVPDLSGYVETKARRWSEVLMEEKTRAHPLVASWRYGLGRVTSLMTEPVGAGTKNWQEWGDYGALLGRIISRTASDEAAFDYRIERNDYEVNITAQRLSVDASLQPKVLTEAGEALAFKQMAPGLFKASTVVDPAEEIRLTASASGRHVDWRLVSGSREDVFPERQVDPRMGLNLDRLAFVTGGAVVTSDNPEITSAARVSDHTSVELFRLWPYVLLLALIAYFTELVYRRTHASAFRLAA